MNRSASKAEDAVPPNRSYFHGSSALALPVPPHKLTQKLSAESFLASVDLLKTNTLTSLWNNLIHALKAVIRVEHPEDTAAKREEIFEAIAEGRSTHWALPPLVRVADLVRNYILT